jgi:V/A-type H+-transporting ATPase subunit I
MGKETRLLDQLDGERESIRERQRFIQQEILKLQDIQRQVNLYGYGLAGITLPGKQSMLSIHMGKLPATNVKRLEDELKGLPVVNMALGQEHDQVHHLLLYMKRDHERIEKILIHAGWTNVDIPRERITPKKDLFDELSKKITAFTEEQKALQDQVTTLVKIQEPHLKALWVSLRVNELCCKIQSHFKSSARTVIFAGWLIASKKKRITNVITEASEGRCYLEWHDADRGQISNMDIPVQLNNPKILAPFQMLVSNFGIPQYGTIDPTPFVMPIYLIMFGLMFADVGQGLVLALLGALGARHFKANPVKQGLYNLCWLIVWCGGSSMLFGVLLGSYFGMQWFKPLWFDFHHIISNNVISEIYFGIGVILLGLLFNWINLIRTGNWTSLWFDRGGLFGGWIYGGGIYIGYYMVMHNYKALPSGPTFLLLVGLPCLGLLLKEPYHYIKHRQDASDKQSNHLFQVLHVFMEWIVELLEIFTGFLSNTISFMRVAALGIAHVCLMISFFTLAQMTSGMYSILILILGNILVIGLEGLSAGIQALRLNYYEFFTKFFHGTGRLYAPISLTSEGE